MSALPPKADIRRDKRHVCDYACHKFAKLLFLRGVVMLISFFGSLNLSDHAGGAAFICSIATIYLLVVVCCCSF